MAHVGCANKDYQTVEGVSTITSAMIRVLPAFAIVLEARSKLIIDDIVVVADGATELDSISSFLGRLKEC